MTKRNLPTARAHQHGSALIASLFVLIVLILLALMVMNMSLMQERMAGNVRESNQAFQGAEATMREIETRLLQVAAGGTGGLGPIPLWSVVAAATPSDCTLSAPAGWADWTAAPWETAPDTGNPYLVYELSDLMMVGGVPRGNPCRPIQGARTAGQEDIGSQYLIVTRAQGPGGVGEVILQSIFWPVP